MGISSRKHIRKHPVLGKGGRWELAPRLLQETRARAIAADAVALSTAAGSCALGRSGGNHLCA